MNSDITTRLTDRRANTLRIVLASLFFATAAIFNAVMDVGSFHAERFNAHPFWKSCHCCKYAGGQLPCDGATYDTATRTKWIFGWNKPVQLTDGFHFSKMAMVVFIFLALYVAIWDGLKNWKWRLAFLAAGYALWNGTFTIFYKWIL